jgi:hypothetical protein
MKLSLIAVLLCVGCGDSYGSLSNPPPNDLGPGPSDASTDVQDAHPYLGPKCCQVTADFTDDPYWQNGLYQCDSDAAVTVGGPSVPWVCNVNSAGMCGGNTGLTCLACDDSLCVIGSACLGFNGTGIVTDCQSGSD